MSEEEDNEGESETETETATATESESETETETESETESESPSGSGEGASEAGPSAPAARVRRSTSVLQASQARTKAGDDPNDRARGDRGRAEAQTDTETEAQPGRWERFKSITPELGMGLLSGGIMALAGAPMDLFPAAFVSLPLLLWALTRVSTIKAATSVGLAMGFAMNTASLYWVVITLMDFGHFPLIAAIPVASLLWLAQGLPIAIAAGVSKWLERRGVMLALVFAPAVVVAYSYTPAIFPFRFATSQLGWLHFVQAADLSGEALLDLGLVGVSTCLFMAIRLRSWKPALAGAAVLGLFAAYGADRLDVIDEARAEAQSLSVGIVQPNIGIFDKHDRGQYPQHLAQLRESSAELEAQGAELVVWPESAYPYGLRRGREQVPRGNKSPRLGSRVPVIFGAVTRGGPCEKWNSVLAMDGSGRLTGVSDKVELLAFGEFVPLWSLLPPLQRFFRCPGFSAGEGPVALAVGEARVGVLNCYEDVLPSFNRALAETRPDMLLNVTNDAWFGETTEPFLHQSLARFRSIELRRDMVRAVNTGVSGHIDAAGRLLVQTEVGKREIALASVQRLNMSSVFARYGDFTTPLCALWLIAAFGMSFRLRRN